MDDAVLAIHFGEPPEPNLETVTEYLTAIFYQNAELDGSTTTEDARERAAELASRRAPGLVEEYEEMGGSPMNAQARAQVAALDERLADRGHAARTELAFQFLEPTIESRIESLADDGIERVILLPIYPICGPSTTVAAIDRAREAIDAEDGWDPTVHAVSGWHRHPTYLRLRADNLHRFVADRELALDDPATRLVFSAHGTPEHYLESGSRYVEYVEEVCGTMAGLVGGVDFDLGYQNHANRDIPWTSPDIEEVIETVDAERVVVEPISFMHEQSETIAELDDELAEEAAEFGLDFHRVPIPHDDPAFARLLADLTEPFLAGVDPTMYQLRECQCSPGASCLNAPRS